MMSKTKKTSIGGQALIEGIMMKGPYISAMAVRLPDGSIDLESWENPPQHWYNRAPIVRGVVNMVQTLIQGYKCLTKSADKAGMEEEPTKFEKWMEEKLGKSGTEMAGLLGAVLGIGLAILLFTVVPATICRLMSPLIHQNWILSVLEGVIKIAIFVLYLFLCSRLKDIRRVFEYHGGEHKTIFCYEAGLELTVENVRMQKRFHPRCGTSFLIIVLIISIIVSSFITWETLLGRILMKLLMLPVIVGVSYEFIKLAGRYTNICTRVISAPGLWLQRLTTAEPDDSQIECAIAAMEKVIPENPEDDNW